MKYVLVSILFIACIGCKSRDASWNIDYSNKLLDTVAILNSDIAKAANSSDRSQVSVLIALREAKLNTTRLIADKIKNRKEKEQVINRFMELTSGSSNSN